MSIFWNTVSGAMRQILEVFENSEIGTKFYLAGGTA